MRLSVVIPALDEAAEIAATVASAIRPGTEVVVVDGGSHDDTVARASEAGARVVASARGRARQLAAGVGATRGDALLLLHADTRLPGGYDDAVRSALARPGVVAGAFAFRFRREGDGGGLRRELALRVLELGVALRNRLFVLPYGDQAIFCRRDALQAAGGIPAVDFMEDLDLVHALRAVGRLVVLPLCVETSPRRYVARGPLRTMLRNWGALSAWSLGVERARIAAWYRR